MLGGDGNCRATGSGKIDSGVGVGNSGYSWQLVPAWVRFRLATSRQQEKDHDEKNNAFGNFHAKNILPVIWDSIFRA